MVSLSYPDDGNNQCFQLEDQSFWFFFRNQIILKKMRLYKNRINSFLDLGGGNGFVSKALQDDGFQVYLCEPGSGAKNAFARGVRNTFQCRLEDLPREVAFNSVGIFDVLEHIEKPVDFLVLIASRLKVGDLVFLTVPAYDFLFSQEDIEAGHFRRYTFNKAQVELSQAGFKILEYQYFFSLLIFPIFIFRTLPYWFGRTKKTAKINEDAARRHRTNSLVVSLLSMSLKLEVFFQKYFLLKIGSSLLIVAEKNS